MPKPQNPYMLYTPPETEATSLPLPKEQGALGNRTQQLRLQDEFPLLVLLARLIRLVILPPNRLPALPTHDVPHDVTAGCHVAFCSFAQGDVDDGVEEEGFAVLAAEVLGWG
jgi:hypothetical protein